jgi:Flp pilus assembly pilin Flp
MNTRWWSLLHAEEGVSSVEYGILLAAFGVVLVAAGPLLADAFRDLITLITGGFSR